VFDVNYNKGALTRITFSFQNSLQTLSVCVLKTQIWRSKHSSNYLQIFDGTIKHIWRHVHSDKFTATCSQRQVHSDMFTATSSQRHVHNDKFTATCSQRQVHSDMFTATCSQRQVHSDMFTATDSCLKQAHR